MSVQHKTKRATITPNPAFWDKDPAYYHEYMSYVETFNKAMKKGLDKKMDDLNKQEVSNDKPEE